MSKEFTQIETMDQVVGYIADKTELKDGRRILSKSDTTGYFKACGIDESTQKAFVEADANLLNGMVLVAQSDAVALAKSSKKPLAEIQTEVRSYSNNEHRKAYACGETKYINPQTKEVTSRPSVKIAKRMVLKVDAAGADTMSKFEADLKAALKG